MKDMEKWGRIFGFYQGKKLSLFIHMIGFTFLSLFWFLGFVQPLSKAFCHASQLCVCVCVCVLADKQWIGAVQSAKIVQLATWPRPKVTRCMTALSFKTRAMWISWPPRSPPGHLLAMISLVDASSKLEGEAQVLYPKLNISPVKIHQP